MAETIKPIKKKKSIGRRLLKWTGWFIASLLFLVLLIYILIQIPAVQQFAKRKVVNYVQGKIGTKVEIKRLDLDFPKVLVLEGVYFEDQSRDTLLAGEKLKVDISLFKLLKNTVEINEIGLEGITAHINRNAAGQFNFDYIIKAFAGEQTKEPKPEDTTAAPMKFSIEDIVLDRINIKYKDDISGYNAILGLGHFDTEIKTFDLQKMHFVIPEINLAGINAKLVQYKPLGSIPPDTTTKTPGPTPQIEIEEADISKIQFDYRNEIDSMFAKLDLGQLTINPGKLDLANQQFDIKKILLANTAINIRLGRKPAAQQVAQQVAEAADSVAAAMESKSVLLRIAKVDFDNNSFTLDNDASPALKRGMDYSHLGITKLKLQAEHLYYQPDSIAGSISTFSFNDKSGVQLNELRTNFLYASSQAYLKDLYLETPDTRIQRNIIIRYPSLAAVAKDINLLQMDADLTGTVISHKDLLLFVPALYSQQMFAGNPNGRLSIDGKILGSVDNLFLNNLSIAGLRNTRLRANGRIQGLPDVNRLNADLQIPELTTTAADIHALVPAGTLPASIRIPENISINGRLKGGMQQIETNLNLNSSFGGATIKGTVANATDKFKARYNAAISLNNFNVGRLLKQDTLMGRITLNANVKGTGFDTETIAAQLDGVVRSAEVKGYTYRNLTFNGSGTKGLFEVKADMNDANADFDLVATADISGRMPAIHATLMIDSISLQPLQLSPNPLRLHGKITADIPVLDIDNLDGKIYVSELLVNTGDRRYMLDTISIVAAVADTGNSIAINSDVLIAKLSGRYTLTGIGAAFQNIINKYYNIGEVAPPATNQNAVFALKMYSSPMLRELMPGLILSDSVIINGAINSGEGMLLVNGRIPAIQYNGTQLQGGQLLLNTTDSGLVYNLRLQSLKSGSIEIPEAVLTGAMVNNDLGFNLRVNDAGAREKYLLAGHVKQDGDAYVLNLNQDGLKLNYDSWTVDPGNRIMFGTAGIMADKFVLSNAGQSLSLQSQTLTGNAPLDAKFTNFQIESLTRIASQDSLALGGTINGNATVSNFTASPVFVADLNIGNFNYKKDTLGDIALKVNNQTAGVYAIDAAITGNGNSVKAIGSYNTNASNFNVDVNVETLRLATVEGFTAGQLKEMDGILNGKLKVTGTADKPSILGELRFKQAAMNIAMLNERFRLEDEAISFRNDGIHFDKFTLRDSSGRSAVIDGAVYTTTYRDYKFNLDVNARNFRILNSTKKDNPLYYGKLYTNIKISVRGDMNKPVVNADIRIRDNTDLVVVLPQSDPQVAARDGIVEFFDQDNPQLDSMLTLQYDSLNKSTITGLDVSANIEIDKNAALSLIIDEANGDFIKLKGEASLSGGIDPSGKISLTGAYTLNEGAYEMSFNLLKRKFTIKEGSTITWNGEPTSADVNITAVYVARAAPIDLVEQQLSGASDEIRNTYKQRLPFNVLLNMKGELLKPEITFDIVLPEANYNINSDIVNASNTRLAQLRQESSEMNKQVFALLLLNRFLAQNPFESSAGTSVSTLAKQSVSKILTDQLNRLAEDLISGVELNFGIESEDDYTTGKQQSRTELNVAVSKQLLNDRIKVSVGSNFELEGPQQTNRQASNIAGDVQVDYKLSRDGRYLLRAYRKNQYQVALQGQVVETGVGFIISMDYNKFKEIFEKRRRRPQGNRQQQQPALPATDSTDRKKTDTHIVH